MPDSKNHPSYLSPKLELRSVADKGGHGLFACQPLDKDETLAVWGGIVVPDENLGAFSDYARTHGLQVDDALYLLPLTEDDPADYFNHSCNPNAGLLGQITLVAMRPIAVGEEICFDYAMSDSNPYDEFECECGSPQCRKEIRADDWKRLDLQDRYRGFFSPYLQKKIDALHHHMPRTQE